ncbi:MAG: prolyl oligopeptidase family serine peptidase [Clostridiales bacterium]|nr:prolyl oligopeptidase family serine peptidase [Clostridiales bacterium]
MLYPCLGFNYLMPMLSACFSQGEIDTEKKRKDVAHKYSCTDNFSSSDIPQFLCYGGKDSLIMKEHTAEYISKLEETGTRHKVVLLPKANHGFGASLKSRRKYGDWIPQYIEWLNREVTVWLGRKSVSGCKNIS